MSILGSIFQAVLPSLFGGLLGGGKTAQGYGNQGVGSMMGASEPAPMQENPTSGTQLGGVLKDAFTDGIKSVVGYYGSGLSGRANRKYLDEAFPELNPWEKAGATATGAGVGLAGQSNEQEMQKKQLDVQQKMQDKNIDLEKLRIGSQVQMNERSASASEASAAISASPMLAQVEALNDAHNARANYDRMQYDYLSGKDTREWGSGIANALLRGWNYRSGDDQWRKKALSALFWQTLGRGVSGAAGGATSAATKKGFK